MNIQILYDSEAAYEGLKSGWGFSSLVDGHLLFDTGENGESLEQNVKMMTVDMSCIDTVVISHDHWDHVGGLEYVVQNASHLKKIYICPDFDPVFKKKAANFHGDVIEADHFTRITNRIYSTGQILCSYKEQPLAEQALILQTDKGFSVITGCAHPGIVEILKKVKSQLSLKEFYTVVGGFHLKNHTPVEIEKIVQEFIALKVRRVAPIHCTGLEAQNIFKKVYGDRCFMLKIGEKVEV
jgi:7,8-dihydropterin-6-yl-methyl-4-(beta-D-ribofuranosyl)aminobenzene 5'-phosphate synthase